MFEKKVLLATAEWRVHTRQIPFLGYRRLKVANSKGVIVEATSTESTHLWRILMELQAAGRARNVNDSLFVTVLTDFAIAIQSKPQSTEPTNLFSGGATYSMFFETLPPAMQAMHYMQKQLEPMGQ